MNTLLLKAYCRFRTILDSEMGQDLPEYAFAVVMIGLGTVAGLNSVATGISIAFNNVSSDLANAVL